MERTSSRIDSSLPDATFVVEANGGLANAELLAIVDTATDGMLMLDERWAIRWANPAVRRMFGFTREELVGKPIRWLYVDAPREATDELLVAADRRVAIEARGRRSDGSVFPMELTLGLAHVEGRHSYTAIVRDITERRLLERRILEAAEELQNRIGRDLHDGLGQLLTGIAFLAKGMEIELPPLHAAKATKLIELINESIRSTRELAKGLCPVDVTEHSLRAAMTTLTRTCSSVFEVPCTFECSNGVSDTSSVVRTQLYLIAREAITNAVRHGRASRVDVSIASHGGRGTLCIRDDGVGLEPGALAKPGIGIRSMQHRARMIGGSLEIGDRDGGGTVVTCRFRGGEGR